jgi:hypothetical protein
MSRHETDGLPREEGAARALARALTVLWSHPGMTVLRIVFVVSVIGLAGIPLFAIGAADSHRTLMLIGMLLLGLELINGAVVVPTMRTIMVSRRRAIARSNGGSGAR